MKCSLLSMKMAGVVLSALALGAHAADAKDEKIKELESKVQIMEKRIKDLEGQLAQRMPRQPQNFSFNDDFRNLDQMLEKLQKEMLNGNDLDMSKLFQHEFGPGMKLRMPGRKPRLGVELDVVSEELKTRFKNEVKEGAFVMSLVPNSPAEKAGMEVGDVITSFDGKAVASPQELIEAVRNAQKGIREIQVSRRGEQLMLKVELGAEQDVTLNGPDLDIDGWLQGNPGLPGGKTESRTEIKVSALELSDKLAKEMRLSEEQQKKTLEILGRHQNALRDEVSKQGFTGSNNGNALNFNVNGNINELAQKHADAAALDLAKVLNDAQLKQWNDYRKTHNSVSFSQSMKTENGGVKPGRVWKDKEEDNSLSF